MDACLPLLESTALFPSAMMCLCVWLYLFVKGGENEYEQSDEGCTLVGREEVWLW